MKKISEYYNSLQHNVLQTALEDVNLGIHDNDFVRRSNLCVEILKELKNLGYQITKIPKSHEKESK
jgi:hypothetical protein